MQFVLVGLISDSETMLNWFNIVIIIDLIVNSS